MRKLKSNVQNSQMLLEMYALFAMCVACVIGYKEIDGSIVPIFKKSKLVSPISPPP